ncbi:MAG: 23S rRNA (uridine(2552)-2'-O)-methyltransferase [Gallionellales bacterium 35-53-114]|jgi:23S rRNA (uridine2552-2'-O)-methyltransferase|nr:MAG: 23S rRNA (uridine(2552)-2'-O)-methyltransferase [Gallionellales bacterium 35-53-114]OYZ65363.1 MAG: 23S rRNA (uridine(2552)-2'-O)-methyltransferase [Gallionellales bacterium 24-53-125]OZB08270.1 MAG: 23S rRNA (uridine(2552)-2'-O)-methyltransferase [Gallionellales bacterium 39-52-133]HQS58204.1 23S rRNA (uridine(2552)-2'-O)-methyltransferase RlmE [Gallionellaceae bacterium]HQS73759.1 23S rRNA (uridine(2552)-2'-O)-methyltransferase RlmE [Gallionellaceae bacterium]
MKPSKTSKQWMREHINDPYVQQAQKDGYRSRAAYKLLEIDERDHLLKPGMVVVDLGATPGGWSQIAANKVGDKGKVIALDLLPLAPLPRVEFILGDFREDSVLAQLEDKLGGKQIELVISDMAPNISGIDMTDQARSIYLAELALEFAVKHLKPGGMFLVKVFQGAGFEEYVKLMRTHFAKVASRKPKASRDRSSEVYMLGTGRL